MEDEEKLEEIDEGKERRMEGKRAEEKETWNRTNKREKIYNAIFLFDLCLGSLVKATLTIETMKVAATNINICLNLEKDQGKT